MAIVAAQVVAGLVAHSVGLLSDAGHNLTDVAAILLSLLAVRLTRRPATTARSFGWHRSTVLAAQANAAAILVVSAVIGIEAVHRLAAPQPVRGGIVVVVALVALAANGLSAWLLVEAGGDLNMRAALLHMAGDALASAGVAVAGLVILLTARFYWLDPAVSLGVGLLIAVEAVRLLKATADVLLESTPAGLDVARLAGAVAAMPGIEAVHDIHAWTLSADVIALSAHLVMEGHPSLEEAQRVAGEVRTALGVDFSITHATLELECESCADPGADPCAMDDLAPLSRPRLH